ncbi:MAG: translation initiation factor IF-3 [Chlorobi bacterium]|nr:translation initiation factor IF-3 [Chlorobiota bacterium]
MDRSVRKVRINNEITAPVVRVVGVEGGQLGIMPISDALKSAYEHGLDLVEVAPQANPPVCRIIDFGKYQYEQHKREKQQRKQQQQTQLKEIRLKIVTDTHDLDFKARHAREFLLEGNKVKVTVLFRGREITHKEFGEQILQQFWQRLEDVAKFDQPIRAEGRTMTMILAPDKDKVRRYQKQLQHQQQSNDSTP